MDSEHLRWLHDWKGPEKGATGYLAYSLRIRLTDPQKRPLPRAKCRLATAPDKVFECDEQGAVDLSVPWDQTAVSVEWEAKEAAAAGGARFYWKGVLRLDIASQDDDMCRDRLAHLSFGGETLEEQVRAYQIRFGREPSGVLDDIRKELVAWHDGAGRPEGGDADQPTSPPPAKPARTTDVSWITLCLLDLDRVPMPGAHCRRVPRGRGHPEMSRTADGFGMVSIPVGPNEDALDIEWAPAAAFYTDDESEFPMSQTVRITAPGGDNETAIANMLHNLGFDAEDLAARKDEYAQFFAETLHDLADAAYAQLSARIGGSPTPGSGTA